MPKYDYNIHITKKNAQSVKNSNSYTGIAEITRFQKILAADSDEWDEEYNQTDVAEQCFQYNFKLIGFDEEDFIDKDGEFIYECNGIPWKFPVSTFKKMNDGSFEASPKGLSYTYYYDTPENNFRVIYDSRVEKSLHIVDYGSDDYRKYGGVKEYYIRIHTGTYCADIVFSNHGGQYYFVNDSGQYDLFGDSYDHAPLTWFPTLQEFHRKTPSIIFYEPTVVSDCSGVIHNWYRRETEESSGAYDPITVEFSDMNFSSIKSITGTIGFVKANDIIIKRPLAKKSEIANGSQYIKPIAYPYYDMSEWPDISDYRYSYERGLNEAQTKIECTTYWENGYQYIRIPMSNYPFIYTDLKDYDMYLRIKNIDKASQYSETDISESYIDLIIYTETDITYRAIPSLNTKLVYTTFVYEPIKVGSGNSKFSISSKVYYYYLGMTNKLYFNNVAIEEVYALRSNNNYDPWIIFDSDLATKITTPSEWQHGFHSDDVYITHKFNAPIMNVIRSLNTTYGWGEAYLYDDGDTDETYQSKTNLLVVSNDTVIDAEVISLWLNNGDVHSDGLMYWGVEPSKWTNNLKEAITRDHVVTVIRFDRQIDDLEYDYEEEHEDLENIFGIPLIISIAGLGFSYINGQTLDVGHTDPFDGLLIIGEARREPYRGADGDDYLVIDFYKSFRYEPYYTGDWGEDGISFDIYDAREIDPTLKLYIGNYYSKSIDQYSYMNNPITIGRVYAKRRTDLRYTKVFELENLEENYTDLSVVKIKDDAIKRMYAGLATFSTYMVEYGHLFPREKNLTNSEFVPMHLVNLAAHNGEKPSEYWYEIDDFMWNKMKYTDSLISAGGISAYGYSDDNIYISNSDMYIKGSSAAVAKSDVSLGVCFNGGCCVNDRYAVFAGGSTYSNYTVNNGETVTIKGKTYNMTTRQLCDTVFDYMGGYLTIMDMQVVNKLSTSPSDEYLEDNDVVEDTFDSVYQTSTPDGLFNAPISMTLGSVGDLDKMFKTQMIPRSDGKVIYFTHMDPSTEGDHSYVWVMDVPSITNKTYDDISECFTKLSGITLDNDYDEDNVTTIEFVEGFGTLRKSSYKLPVNRFYGYAITGEVSLIVEIDGGNSAYCELYLIDKDYNVTHLSNAFIPAIGTTLDGCVSPVFGDYRALLINQEAVPSTLNFYFYSVDATGAIYRHIVDFGVIDDTNVYNAITKFAKENSDYYIFGFEKSIMITCSNDSEEISLVLAENLIVAAAYADYSEPRFGPKILSWHGGDKFLIGNVLNANTPKDPYNVHLYGVSKSGLIHGPDGQYISVFSTFRDRVIIKEELTY